MMPAAAPDSGTEPLLDVRGLHKNFGGIRAIAGLDLRLARGECLGVIGPNGAGKTALVNVVTGFYRPSAGTVCFGGRDISRLKLHQIGRMGIARTYQNIRVFRRMTVLENVLVGLPRFAQWPVRSFLDAGRWRGGRERALHLLERFELADRADTPAGILAYGEARRLEIVRALACEPRLLLLDEPAAGMNTEETARLIADIRASRGLVEGLLLIEHDMSLITELADRVIAMENGAKIAEGRPRDVLADPWVREAYLGLE
jgi:branched-chain amino acid transport system ATP-binding protein